MVKARIEYKNTVRKFNFERDKQKSFKLLNAKVKDAKEYWKLLKNSVSQPKFKNISITDFENYFKAVNNPDDPFYFFQPDEDILYFNERFLKSETQIMFDELNGIITVEKIRRSINQLKMVGSVGQNPPRTESPPHSFLLTRTESPPVYLANRTESSPPHSQSESP